MSSFQQFLSFSDQYAVTLLANISIKVAVVLAFTAIVCRLLHRQSSSARHLVLTIAVVVSLLMPLAVGFMPPFSIAVLPESFDVAKNVNRQASDAKLTASNMEELKTNAPLPPPLQSTVPIETESKLGSVEPATQGQPYLEQVGSIPTQSGSITIFSYTTLLSIWAIGVFVVAARFVLILLRQWWRNRWLDLVQDDSWNGAVAELSGRINLSRSVATFESARRNVPAVFGIFRSYLVVPDNWRDWSDEQRTCILLHELAHVKRFDVATQFLGRLIVILHWFNPLTWYVVRQLRIERELACDDYVLATGQCASDYADQLLLTLKLYRPQPFAMGVAMAHSARIDHRIHAILDQTRCRLPMSRKMVGVCALSAALMMAALGAASFASKKTTPSGSDDPNFAAHFSGRVTGPDGKPVRGVQIFVVPDNRSNESNEPGPVRARTDANGRFKFDAPDMTVTDLDGIPTRRPCIVIATSDGYGPDWKLTRGRTLSGSSVIQKPIKGTELTLKLVKDDVPIRGLFLDPDGRPLVGAHVQLIQLSIPRWRDFDAAIERTLQPYSIFSQPDVDFSFTRPCYLPGVTLETMTDIEGRFTLSGIGRDRFVYLKVSAPNVVDSYVMTMTGDALDIRNKAVLPAQLIGADFTLQLKRGRTIQGRVIDRDTREPIPGMQVGVGRKNHPRDGIMHPYQTVSDATGHFEITGLDPKFKKPTITAVSAPGMTYLSADAQADGDSPVLIECQRGIPFRLKLVDEQGRPVEAEVIYNDVKPNPHSLKGFNYPCNTSFSRAVKTAEGTYQGYVSVGPGAVLVKTPGIRDYRPAYVDPKSFFAPDRMDWTAQEQITAYGTQDTLSTYEGLFDQNDFAAIVLVNPEPNSKPLELTVTVVRAKPRRVSLVDPQGKPVVGVTTRGMTSNIYDYEPPLRVASFMLNNLHPDRARDITFIKEDHQLIGFLMARADGATPYIVRMQPWATLTGRIVNKNGVPLNNVNIAIKGDTAGSEVHYGKPDSEGKFRVEKLVPNHRYTVQAYDRSGRLNETVFEKFVLRSGEVRNLGEITWPSTNVKPVTKSEN